MIREQVLLHLPSAQQKSISLTCELDEVPLVYGDPDGLEEVLTNLVTNAIKYSPTDSSVTVSATTDTGFGIPEEDLAEIFNRFYRVKDKNTREIHGTGLGLAIVKSIVDAHQGSIRVESKLDHGTTFLVTLPVE